MRSLRPAKPALAALLYFLGSACAAGSDSGTTFYGGGETAERRDSLPLELSAGERLRVEQSYGNIAVRVAEGESPRVEAHWRASGPDQETAEAVLARYELELTRGDGTLEVRPVGEPLVVKATFGSQRLMATADLTIFVPAGVALAARSASGDVRAEGALSTCRLESSYGNLEARGVRGETVLSTTSGEARVEDVDGGPVDARTQYGDVTAIRVSAAKIALATGSGNVTARGVQGELGARSSYGNLAFEDCAGALDAVTGSGDVSVRGGGTAQRKLATTYGNVTASNAVGDLDVRTSSGAVDISGADGRVRAESTYGGVSVAGKFTVLEAATTSGDVRVRAAPGSTVEGPWRIHSSYGNLDLRLPGADFACQLEASATTGSVEFPGVEGPGGKPLRSVSRRLNAGGGNVAATTASGDVRIRFD